MLHDIIHAIEHTMIHTWLMIPILFITYIVIIYVENKNSERLKEKMNKGLNPITSALFGIIPQCSLSVAIADLFNRNKVTVGTLLAVFISTSDEAILILFSASESWTSFRK